MSPLRKSRGVAGPSPSASAAATLQTSDRYLAQQLSDAARALNVLPIFAMLPCFWMLYDQQGSVWTLQASRMNLHGVIQPEQINVLNPIGLFVMIPVFDKVIYPALQKQEIDISPLRRMGWGMVIVSFAFYLSGVVEYVIDYRIQNELPPISVAWQIPQIALMTVAEIFISVTGKLCLIPAS
jgi:proton-dependent oligopeptide transporter, POT family